MDNKKFLEEITKYKKLCADADDSDMPQPPITEFIGKCFLDIAKGLSYKPNFINYTYRDEMISDGIENCIQYCTN